MEDNFLSQVTDSPARGNVVQDLLVDNAGELTGTPGLEAAWAAGLMHWWSVQP